VAAAALVVAALRLRRSSGAHSARRSMPAFAQYPRQYVVHRGRPPAIDGDVHKAAWQRVPWSEPFLEIRGPRDAPEGSGPGEAQATRMKMLWDDEFLYIAAIMDVVAGDELVARFTERNSPIFHTDSDFEVFVDPAGCCHGYKELELNALNTVWNLMLNKPYADGGGERSGRVAREGDADYWEVRRQRTAARVTRGVLHDASAPAQWCTEIALAHADTLPGAPVRGPTPSVGASWRINFSRVEKGGEVNWVWSPQVVWTPGAGRHTGQVNMHLPDAWGYAVFADADGKLADGSPAEAWRDPAWPARQAAVAVYYAARAFREANGRGPHSLAELRKLSLLDEAALEAVDEVSLLPAGEAASAEDFAAEAVGGGWAAHITQDRLLRVRPVVPS